MHYMVKRASGAAGLHDGWDAGQWGNVDALELKYHMGEKPGHFPETQAKLLYDAENLYVLFRVEDQYVRCVASKTQGNVCRDSCVEFFFAPEDTTTSESNYFNLEVNCGGTILFHYGEPINSSGCNRGHIEPSDCEQVEVQSSLPRIIDPEITTPVSWILGYKLPFNVIKKYSGAQRPGSGTKWRANFYKCADETSHPHWLTWAPVDNPAPKFHLPQFFGGLEFE